MSYLNARYLNPTQGQFISQDPSFLAVSDAAQLKKMTNRDQQEFLADPQLANSYGYGRDNPVTQKDPEGKIVPIILGALAAYGWAQTYVDYVNFQTVTTYPEQFSDAEIRDTGYKLLADILLAGVAREAKDVENFVWGAGSVVLDTIDMHCANHTCLNFGPGNPAVQAAKAFSNKSTTGGKGMPFLSTQSKPPGSSPQFQNGPLQQQQKPQSGSGGINLSFQAQVAAIQAQINQIQAQINVIVQQMTS